jgi:hypothetical protein
MCTATVLAFSRSLDDCLIPHQVNHNFGTIAAAGSNVT